uniref:Sp5 transcription factor n=1 Tax=Bos indicus x Bos taurus TaxID=30522 RepID=A0A4W2DDY7_BOBOX
MSTLPMLRVRGPQAGKRRRTERGRRLPISASNLTQFLPRTPSGPALEPANFSDRSRFGLWRPTTAQAAHEKFLRAEMGHDYHLAKKLCQMILIYEPENPEAKEFFSLIEEMLLMEKAQNLEEDDDESEEDNSESEGESTEDPSEESSDECEDG